VACSGGEEKTGTPTPTPAPVPGPTGTLPGIASTPTPLPTGTATPGPTGTFPGIVVTPTPLPTLSVTWSRVPHAEAALGAAGSQSMNSVTTGGPGLVAVGFDESGRNEDAAVWTSPDGIAWFRVPHDEAVFGGEGSQVMGSVIAGGPGLLAVGVEESGGNEDAAVWVAAAED